MIEAHKQVDRMNMVNKGDRVTWEQRPARDRLKAKMLTGIVRDIKLVDGYHYAVVATDPDQRLTMPEYDKLRKVQP